MTFSTTCAGLNVARLLGLSLLLEGDSKLVLNQLANIYATRAPNLKQYKQQADAILVSRRSSPLPIMVVSSPPAMPHIDPAGQSNGNSSVRLPHPEAAIQSFLASLAPEGWLDHVDGIAQWRAHMQSSNSVVLYPLAVSLPVTKSLK